MSEIGEMSHTYRPPDSSWAAAVSIASSNEQWEREGFRAAFLDVKMTKCSAMVAFTVACVADSNGLGLFNICMNGGGEKEDLAWMQVMAISSKIWLKSLILFCQSADMERLKVISLAFQTYLFGTYSSSYLET